MKKMRATRVTALLAAGALALSLSGTSLAAKQTVKATAANTWNPDYVHITKGDRVIWKNPARHNTPHDVWSYGGNWKKRVSLEPGERTAKRFKRKGSFKYRCRIHSSLNDGVCSGMCGRVHVGR